MEKSDGKPLTLILGNYKLDRFTLVSSTSCDASSPLSSEQRDDPTIFDENAQDWKQGDDSFVKEIWKLSLSLKIIINAEYLPGKLKFRADC